jgi:hypothetical protein
MSFALTTEQIRKRTKTVTRRVGWRNLKPGTLLRAVKKCQGLKKGEKIEQLAIIRVVDVRREALNRMDIDTKYGFSECRREGFRTGQYSLPWEFICWFAISHRCEIDAEVTRIRFEYVEDAE